MRGALQIASQRRHEMSKGQSLLLKTICDCVKNQTPLLFEDVVICYYIGVKKTLYWTQYDEISHGIIPFSTHKNYDILVEFGKGSYIWNKKIKDLIKSWFVSAIGLLVIKGWLTVLPVINIE